MARSLWLGKNVGKGARRKEEAQKPRQPSGAALLLSLKTSTVYLQVGSCRVGGLHELLHQELSLYRATTYPRYDERTRPDCIQPSVCAVRHGRKTVHVENFLTFLQRKK